MPEERVVVPIVHQAWRDMLMLHWPFPPEAIARMLPSGLEPDTWEGQAWVSITPFRVERFRPPLVPPLPGVSNYPETNVRTYVRGPGDLDGLWFLSLEVDSAVTTIGGRLGVNVPYRWADMEVDSGGGVISYRSRRRGTPGIGHDISIRPGELLDAPDGSLDHWLAGRWRAWTRLAGRLATVPVQHEPWPLQQVEVLHLHETLLESVGLTRSQDVPIAHYATGVDARLGAPRPR